MGRTPLDTAYAHCRLLHRRHGRTYYLATKLLPAWKRPHVHALYGFTRYTDDLVDHGPDAGREQRLAAWSDRFTAGLRGGPVPDDPILPAVLHTIAEFRLDHTDFAAFLRSMRMDLRITGYADYDRLLEYMEGSAAVIGTMMLPILLAAEEPGAGRVAERELARAREPARQLGLAFQLTNFIRDVAEDLDRGRVYLPRADLDRFGVSRVDLARAPADARVRRLVAFEIDRARRHYDAAQEGIAMLPPRSRRCVRLAYVLYGGILDQVERAGHDVLAGRATVPPRQRAVAVLRELAWRG